MQILTVDTIGELYPLAHILARRIEWSPDDHDDVVQYGMLGLLDTLRRPSYDPHRIETPEAYATDILRRWMKWYYTRMDRTVSYVEFEPWMVPIRNRSEAFELNYLQEYFAEVERVLGPTARQMAEELVDPSPRVIAIATEEMERKARRFAAGEKVRGHSTLVIKHEHIRKATNLTEVQWPVELTRLRQFTAGFLAREA